ncbi:hypothetical protein GQ53DRAFT_507628 [Thozetella sp. PMI_491]|nr:hypothetical protein GQ53DRAFT_507628 [Thozetella sp. PMI_491]
MSWNLPQALSLVTEWRTSLAKQPHRYQRRLGVFSRVGHGTTTGLSPILPNWGMQRLPEPRPGGQDWQNAHVTS